MTRRIWIAVVVLAVAGGVGWLAVGLRGDGAQRAAPIAPSGGGEAPPRVEQPPDPAPRARDVEPARELEARPEEEAGAPQAAPGEELTAVEGRVLDLAGEPVAQLAIVAATRPDAVLATSAWDGTFAFEVERRHTRVEARGEGWATVRAAAIDPTRPSTPAIVVVAPAVPLAGRVVDPRGAGVASARLAVEEDWRGLASFPLPLDRSERRTVDATADAEGRFRIEAAPLVPDGRLVARAEGYVTARLYLPEQARDDLVIELTPTPTGEEGPQSEPILFGTVRFPDGEPAPGARVQLVRVHATTDELGRFEFELPGWLEDDALLVAMLDGWQPAVRDDFRVVTDLGGLRVGPIELTLPGPELAIAGRVELADGAPAEGWRVQLADPTVLDGMMTPPPTLERRGRVSYEVDPTLTDAGGRFRIEALTARDYRLRLWDPESYVSVESGPVAAGTEDLVLRVPEDALLARFTGRVLTQAGLPLEGAQVSLRFVVERTGSGLTWQTPAQTSTDAEGRFVLEQVPRRAVDVLVSGEGVETLEHEPPGGELPEEPLELRVWRTAHVRFDFSAADPIPDSVRLLDVDGGMLSMEKRSAGGVSSSPRLQLQDGQAPVVSVSERAATLVLERDREELERRPVHLVVGEVNELGP